MTVSAVARPEDSIPDSCSLMPPEFGLVCVDLVLAPLSLPLYATAITNNPIKHSNTLGDSMRGSVWVDLDVSFPIHLLF